MLKRILVAFILSISLAKAIAAQQSPPVATIDRFESASAETEQLFSSFKASGHFTLDAQNDPTPFSVKGKFEWVRKNEKFWCKMEFGKSSANAMVNNSLLETTYIYVSDGESILVACFSPRYSLGCDAHLYDASSSSYRHSNPYIPFEPHKPNEFFLVPKTWYGGIAGADESREGLSGIVTVNSNRQIRFRLDQNCLFLPSTFSILKVGSRAKILEGNRSYRIDDGRPIPVSNTLKLFGKDGEPGRTVEMHFDEFAFQPNTDDSQFTLDGIDLCDKLKNT